MLMDSIKSPSGFVGECTLQDRMEEKDEDDGGTDIEEEEEQLFVPMYVCQFVRYMTLQKKMNVNVFEDMALEWSKTLTQKQGISYCKATQRS